MNRKIECILFDLDGTFADTSKDMCDALNTILTEKKFHSSQKPFRPIHDSL